MPDTLYSIVKNIVTSLNTLWVKLLQMVLEKSKLGHFLWLVHLEGGVNVVPRWQAWRWGFSVLDKSIRLPFPSSYGRVSNMKTETFIWASVTVFTVISQCREPAHSRLAIVISELKKSSMNIRWWQKCQFRLSPRVPSWQSFSWDNINIPIRGPTWLQEKIGNEGNKGEVQRGPEYQPWFPCNHSLFGKYLIIRIKATPFFSDFISDVPQSHC